MSPRTVPEDVINPTRKTKRWYHREKVSRREMGQFYTVLGGPTM